ncbi:type II toxin-antitoxin system RelE/ParE family toxin [Candidatus Uhrbacteria bacterium]|nr:type II toxin-antitoxin system RelE/ParE family toxin [Candidatus Uhrbacteria bacterium]
MIKSFRDKKAEKIFHGKVAQGFSGSILKVVQRRLIMLHAAVELRDLRIPPGNRLEALRGDRKGQHSIRINDKWRICFRWIKGVVHDVEIVDYHK